MYILYEEFCDKISYEAFKKCYKHQTYTHLTPTVSEYPYNIEFSSQFTSNNNLEYDEVVDIRNRYNNGEFWKGVFKDYCDKFTNEMSFWRAYTGLSYKIVMPKVFTEENKKLHSKGVTNTEIYKLYPQITPNTVRDIINHKTWRNIV